MVPSINYVRMSSIQMEMSEIW